MPAHATRPVFKLLVPTLVLWLSGLAFEALFRVFFVAQASLAAYQPIGDAILGATIVIDQLEYHYSAHYNRFGFRGPEFELQKRAGERVILFLGDSFAEGFGVEEAKRFSDLTVNILRQQGYSVSGRNVGQLATNPITYLDNLQRFGVALEPDLVVTAVFLGNDFQGAAIERVGRTLHVNERPLGADAPDQSILSFLTLGYLRGLVTNALLTLEYKRTDWPELVAMGPKTTFVRRPFKPLESRHFWDVYFRRPVNERFFRDASGLSTPEYDRLVQKVSSKVVQESYAGRINPSLLLGALFNLKDPAATKRPSYTEEDYTRTEAMLDAMETILASRRIRHIVLLIPDISEVRREEFETMLRTDLGYSDFPEGLHQVSAFHKRLLKHLTDARVSVIDLAPLLSRSQETPYHRFDTHLTEAGHAIVARALLEKIREYWETP